MASFWRASLLPPAYREQLTSAQWGAIARMRMVFIGLAIATDVAILLGLWGNPNINQTVLRVFACANIGILAVAFALSVAMLRWRAVRHNWVAAVSSVGEAATLIIWVQATGTLTSYFVLVGVILTLWYRLYFSYWVALTIVSSLFVFHFGAVILEAAGVLQAEALFLGEPSRAYTVELYRWFALLSITWCYVLCFVGSNVVVNRLREKDRAIAEIQREMDRVAEEVEHGRLTGTILADDYALGELLGRGGVGEIYMARRVSDEATVAVKVLHGHLLDDATTLERFKREAQVAERVPAEFRAQVYDVGCDARQHLHYIVMEYLRGEDLAAFLRRRGPLAPEVLVPLARRIAMGLDAAHRLGVVHRDLKPQNVFLVHGAQHKSGGYMDVRLLDFGMSKWVDAPEQTLTRVNVVIGTLGYMAPEQALGRVAEVGPASDIFAFAALLYRALTGKPPFQAGDVLEAIREVAHVHPPPASSLSSNVPVQVDAVLSIGLAKSAADRYATATEMIDDLALAAENRLPVAVIDRARAIRRGIGEDATLTAADTIGAESLG